MILDAIRGPEANVTSKSPRYNVPPMRLLLKFNLILILVFAAGVAAADDGIRRRYADLHFQAGRPLLQEHQARIDTFLAQTVPAYAATEAFNYLHGDYPDYTYKEATLNSTNLRDRAVDWEADVIQVFRAHPEQKELSGERDTPAGRALFLATVVPTSKMVGPVNLSGQYTAIESCDLP